jgi:hypothetical protein
VKLSFVSSDFGDCGSAIDIMVASDSIIQDFVWPIPHESGCLVTRNNRVILVYPIKRLERKLHHLRLLCFCWLRQSTLVLPFSLSHAVETRSCPLVSTLVQVSNPGNPRKDFI